MCVSFLSDIFCMNFKISHVSDYCICIQNCMWHCSVWSSELWQLWYEDLLQVCPQLRHHPIWQVPPGRVTDLMPQATNPKQSLSIDINRSERKYHWLQLLQFPDEEHHHRKLAQTFAVRSCVLSYPRWRTCIKLFH